MKSMLARRVCHAALLLSMLPALQVHAQMREELRSRAFSDGEWALLPEWCIDTQQGPYGGPEGGAGLNKSPRAGQWLGLMGTDFWNMHHYCRGLTDENRLKRADLSPRERTALMESAINEYRYVIRTSKPTMPLMPEAFLRIGDLQVTRGQLPEASAAFEQARKLKPDYWPAYSRWAEVLIELKQMERARALLEEGLAHSPQQPVLLQRLRQAGGAPRAAAVRVSAAASGAAASVPSPAAAPAAAPVSLSASAAPAAMPSPASAAPQPAASSPP